MSGRCGPAGRKAFSPLEVGTWVSSLSLVSCSTAPHYIGSVCTHLSEVTSPCVRQKCGIVGKTQEDD